ncbi:uncharacterized protein LOC17893685 isoform X2 [Capsella rubella]|uniref:uncharacterized protein LOC17893685 isoform X2 n=1 Tax=Capsella rubella TaxID=81985 RepID=UPI000CD4CFA3|nr:uncharacterized protein LOC17893685 isoform X2 [Capsella rubella]
MDQEAIEMSSKEMIKKKDKGKEIVTSSDHHHKEKVSMILTEQEIEFLLQSSNKENLEKSKKDNADEKEKSTSSSSSSKIIPCIFYTSDEKARLRWSSDLHDCFVNAVEKLGGPNKATPKSVKEMMEVEGIALHHVKSHLQKFRLGRCNIQNGTNQYIRRFKSARDVKTCASINPPRPQVNIKPRLMGAVKPKPKKEKEVQGSLYMLIENDLRLQRYRRAQRMQKAFAIETQHFKASMVPTSPSQQHNNYVSSTSTSISQEPSSHTQEEWFIPFSYHFPYGATNPFPMNYSQQQPSIIIPQNITSVEDFCNNGNLQFNEYNMAQGFFNPYMCTIESQSMPPCFSTVTTPQQLQLNDGYVIHDSYDNATSVSATVPPIADPPHQETLNNAFIFSKSPESIQGYVPQYTYSSYPPYNTLEVVKAQLNALHSSNSTSQTHETLARHETNLSSSVTRDEVDDPVDKYIDWAKVEERDIELDPVEVLEALGFGVSP